MRTSKYQILILYTLIAKGNDKLYHALSCHGLENRYVFARFQEILRFIKAEDNNYI